MSRTRSKIQLHLEHFPGQDASASLPMAVWSANRAGAWSRLTEALGLDTTLLSPGDQVRVERDESTDPPRPRLGGTVVDIAAGRLSLVIDDPAPGTAFLAAEGAGDEVSVSCWAYLHGPEGASLADRHTADWGSWLSARSDPAERWPRCQPAEC